MWQDINVSENLAASIFKVNCVWFGRGRIGTGQGLQEGEGSRPS